MIKRRGIFLRNIWWLMPVIIIAGIISNYFFMKSAPIFPAGGEHQHELNQALSSEEHLLDIQTWQTATGLNVYYLPIDTLPIIDLQLVFAAGSAYEPQLPGLARLTNQMIGKNTTELSTNQLADRFESLGAITQNNITRDTGTLSLRTVSFEAEKKAIFDLFAHTLSHITFTEDSLLQEKEELITELFAQEQSPNTQAAKAFHATIYGEHPYATPVLGNIETVSALTLDEVQAFYNRYYNIANATLVIVGNISREEAEQLAQMLDTALPRGEAAGALAKVELPSEPILQNIDFPSSQKHIILGLPTIEKGNPDFFPFFVGNHILGDSGLSSQLFEIVREEHGLAYSIKSQLAPLKQKGPFFIVLQTRNDESDAALLLVQDHLNDFIKNGPTQEELNKAKKNIEGQFLMAFDSNAAITSAIGMLAFYKLPLDYFDHYLDQINAVTLDDIKRIFSEYITTQNMVTITLGEYQAPIEHDGE